MFGKYNGFVSKARVSACMYFLVVYRTSYIWHHLSIHELVVGAGQLDSVDQVVRALHRNRRAAGSIPARGPIVAIFATAPG